MDDPGTLQEHDDQAMQRIEHKDLVKGIDLDEDGDVNDNSRGLRRNGQDEPGKQPSTGSTSERGSAWDGKSGRVV